MAEVSCLHLHGDDEDHGNLDFLLFISPCSHDCSQDLHSFDISPSDLEFLPPEFCLSGNAQRNPDPDSSNQVNLVIPQCAQQSCSSSRVIVEKDLLDFGVRVSIEDEDIESKKEIVVGSGFGLGLYDDNDDDDDDWGYMIGDCGHGDFSDFTAGFSVTRFDEDPESEIIRVDDDFCCDDEAIASASLCLDAFHLEDDNGNDNDYHHDIRWEVLNMPPVAQPETDNWEVFLNSQNLEPERGFYQSVDDLDWEVFLNAGGNLEGNTDFSDQFEDYNENDTEEEILFGQFADNGDSGVVQPPASKRAVDNLLTVVMAPEDVNNNNAHCAVCKDEIGVGEMAKQLPCTHQYHGDCIVPWLRMRNTCPVCRHELPTDNLNYERGKAERVGSED